MSTAIPRAVSVDGPGLERDLAAWSAAPEPARFPYLPVVGAYHAVGKHFVAASVLKHLDVARSALSQTTDIRPLIPTRNPRGSPPSWTSCSTSSTSATTTRPTWP
jgi:hypothetical protein